jgi:hypothetical protein
VTAEDKDSGENKRLSYSFIDAEPEEGRELFTIQDDVDANRGTITVGKDLTDKWGTYRLTVMVSGGFKRKAYFNSCIILGGRNDKSYTSSRNGRW